MNLKVRIERQLKAQGKTLLWLAEQMGKNPDGLKHLIQEGTLKYNDMIAMADVLGVGPGLLFGEEQIRDKDRIIELMSEK